MDSIIQPNINDFYREKSTKFDELVKEYGFSYHGFDTEIDHPEDFEEVIHALATLVFTEVKINERGITEDGRQIYVNTLINGENYKFFSGSRNWIQTQPLLSEFNQIFLQKNLNIIVKEGALVAGGNFAVLIIADKIKLKEAIKRGFPCCLDFQMLIKKTASILSLRFESISVKLDTIPHFNTLRSLYVKELNFLNKKANPNAEDFTIEQVNLVTETDDSMDLDIFINSLFASKVFIKGNTLTLRDSDFDLALLYTLLKHFNCEVFFNEKGTDKKERQDNMNVLKLIEHTFSS